MEKNYKELYEMSQKVILKQQERIKELEESCNKAWDLVDWDAIEDHE
ncbi:MAG: hypothetical protein PHY47_01055 [Lachnospiraceae bacterium]|nr:hypothetical protein [Lachnospiraceae bacterium]